MLRCVLWPNMWSILKNFLCTLKILCSVDVGLDILYISVRSIWSTVLFSFSISLFIFVLDVLSIIESGISNWNLLLLLHCCFPLQFCRCLLHIFDCSDVGCIYIYNHYISSVNRLFHHYVMLRLLCYLLTLSVLSKYDHLSFSLVTICIEYLFPSFHFQSICVLKSKVSLFQAAYCWIRYIPFLLKQSIKRLSFDWRV